MTLFTIKKAFHEMKNMGLKKFLKTFKFQVSYHNKKKNNKYLKKIYKESIIHMYQRLMAERIENIHLLQKKKRICSSFGGMESIVFQIKLRET